MASKNRILSNDINKKQLPLNWKTIKEGDKVKCRGNIIGVVEEIIGVSDHYSSNENWIHSSRICDYPYRKLKYSKNDPLCVKVKLRNGEVVQRMYYQVQEVILSGSAIDIEITKLQTKSNKKKKRRKRRTKK